MVYLLNSPFSKCINKYIYVPSKYTHSSLYRHFFVLLSHQQGKMRKENPSKAHSSSSSCFRTLKSRNLTLNVVLTLTRQKLNFQTQLRALLPICSSSKDEPRAEPFESPGSEGNLNSEQIQTMAITNHHKTWLCDRLCSQEPGGGTGSFPWPWQLQFL